MTAIAQEKPYYPIIYLRGYAGGDDAVEDAVVDPYMGFNVGSSMIRQSWDGTVRRFFFESPLVRLMKEHGYRDVYSGGDAMPMENPLAVRSIFIYRYYEAVSESLGDGLNREIEDFAAGLVDLIFEIKKRLVTQGDADDASFRVCLIGHSMGGLIIRCFLQNAGLGVDDKARRRVAEARRAVDKVVTYGTPHNGIELEIIGNVPGFFTRNNADNFNRDRMRKYLGLPAGAEINDLNGQFDPNRFFCLIGTNADDYPVAAGWSKRVVGPMSDGLVRIRNAAVHGPGGNGQKITAPRAFVHRSHSGPYGIVNSEEGYQNLTRFLFGNVRVDGVLEVKDLTLPTDVEARRKDGHKVRASYHFEAALRTRGGLWDLSRRIMADGSAVFRTYAELFETDNGRRNPHLFSAFLSAGARVDRRRPSLGFAVEIGIRVPEYEVDGMPWRRNHFPGSYIFRDTIILEAVPPRNGEQWRLRYGFGSQGPTAATQWAESQSSAAEAVFSIPLEQKVRPGFSGTLRLTAAPWNQ